MEVSPAHLPLILATDDNKILYGILILCFEGAPPNTPLPYNSATPPSELLWVTTHTSSIYFPL